MTKYTNDYIKLMSVTNFSTGKGIDEIENYEFADLNSGEGSNSSKGSPS